jgi:hypothetical protein
MITSTFIRSSAATDIASGELSNWVREEMGTADLRDPRLKKRLFLVMQRMFSSPVASLKAAFRGWAETIAAYRFFNNEKVTEAALLAPHQEATLQRVKTQESVLVIQDTTEIDYSSKKELEGKGPLSVHERQGFFAHSQYVVTPERVPLGLWGTLIYARDEVSEHPSRKDQPIELKESYRWLEGYRDACRLAEMAPDTRVISACDREGDIYEIFLEWQRRRQKGEVAAEWLIRSCQDRSLVPFEETQANTGVTANKLRAAVEQSAVLGTIEFDVLKHTGNKKVKGNRVKTIRQARRVAQEVRAIEVMIKAPWRKGKKLEAVKIGVVLAREKNPPAGQDRIEWVLLTSLPVAGFESAQEVIALYLARWDIEVFHRVLKTGCRVEKLQLTEADRIKPAIVLYMIVAWRITYVMKLGRTCPNLPCDVIFEEAEWRAVYHVVHRKPAVEKPTLGEMVDMIGSLGGHLGRKGDGAPGAQSMWQGLMRAKDFALAWLLFTGQIQEI